MIVTAPGSRHWSKRIDADGICWLLFDKQGSSTNVFSREALLELREELDALVAEIPAGVVIASAKSNGFIAGADIAEFLDLTDQDQVIAAAVVGQTMCQQVADLPCPTVAAINGFTLGGGLELALACDYRVAINSYDRSIGLPEVQLGFNPGWGGTVRLVRLLGAPLALDLMLSGRSVSAAEALTMGLVDRAVSADALDDAATAILKERPSLRRPRWYLRLLNLVPVRPWLARSIRARAGRRVSPAHYPAPFAIIDLWQRFGASGAAAYAAEAKSIGKLLVSRASKNLVRVYFLRERLKRLGPKQKPVQRVHVIGAGVMGGDIAGWCALRGLDVTIQDREIKYIVPALARAKKLFGKLLRGPGQAAAAEQRLKIDIEAEHVGNTDVVIEAIIEDLNAKQTLFRELESKVSDTVILATNTSSIPLEAIAATLADPQRFVGLHFFNPVSRLPLVEVIRGEQTDENTLAMVMSFATQIGKLPLPCRSAPGFLINRILAPYMLEALRAYEGGIALETIDQAAEDFGMPTGPVELADRVGLDVALHVSELLVLEVPAGLRSRVEAGDLGVKTGKGFYKFENNRPKKCSVYAVPDEELKDRLILALLNEAMACYEDGVVEDLDLLDAGVIFGTGFAPFTGGPIHYARERGIKNVIERLEYLAERYGRQFTPRAGWRKLAVDK